MMKLMKLILYITYKGDCSDRVLAMSSLGIYLILSAHWRETKKKNSRVKCTCTLAYIKPKSLSEENVPVFTVVDVGLFFQFQENMWVKYFCAFLACIEFPPSSWSRSKFLELSGDHHVASRNNLSESNLNIYVDKKCGNQSVSWSWFKL